MHNHREILLFVSFLRFALLTMCKYWDSGGRNVQKETMTGKEWGFIGVENRCYK